MFRRVRAALRTAVRTASSTLVALLPTISLSPYTWSLTARSSARWFPVLDADPGTTTYVPRPPPSCAFGGRTYVVSVSTDTSYDGFARGPPLEDFAVSAGRSLTAEEP